MRIICDSVLDSKLCNSNSESEMSASIIPEGVAATDSLRRLLGMKLRVTLSDGRVAVGEFQCMDKVQLYELNHLSHSINCK